MWEWRNELSFNPMCYFKLLITLYLLSFSWALLPIKIWALKKKVWGISIGKDEAMQGTWQQCLAIWHRIWCLSGFLILHCLLWSATKGDCDKFGGFGCSSCLNLQISQSAAHNGKVPFIHMRFNFTLSYITLSPRGRTSHSILHSEPDGASYAPKQLNSILFFFFPL